MNDKYRYTSICMGGHCSRDDSAKLHSQEVHFIIGKIFGKSKVTKNIGVRPEQIDGSGRAKVMRNISD